MKPAFAHEGFGGHFLRFAQKMVEGSGAISNQDALKELIKWGAMIGNMRSFSGGRDVVRK